MDTLTGSIQFISGPFNIPCFINGTFMVCTAHRLQCKTPHFPKHEFPIHNTDCSSAAEVYVEVSQLIPEAGCGIGLIRTILSSQTKKMFPCLQPCMCRAQVSFGWINDCSSMALQEYHDTVDFSCV